MTLIESMLGRILTLVLVCSIVCSIPALAQSRSPRYEIGLQLAGVHLRKIDEAPFGVGARFDLNVTPLVAVETEFMHYPENPSGNFGESSALIGARIGKHSSRYGLFGKASFGTIHFGGQYFDLRLNQKTHSQLNAGAVLEYYPSPHVVLRLDAADTVIYYGAAWIFPSNDPLGTVHNFQPAIGVGFRW